MDKGYDLQKHLTTINTISILITIALFDKLKEQVEPTVVFKVIKFFLVSLLFSLGYLLMVVGAELLGEKADKITKWVNAILMPVGLVVSWGTFLIGMALLGFRFIR